MSGFSSMSSGAENAFGRLGSSRMALPDPVFRSEDERRAYQRIIDGSGNRNDLKIKKVKVEIFDMSDHKQVKKYEKLWKELLEKASRMEVAVDARKDLVHRADGTSYWMKYVEYTEFSGADEGAGGGNRRHV